MLETSKDVLFFGLTICVVVFTFFMCWALYYIVMMLKRAHEAIKEVSELVISIKEKINKLEQVFKRMEEKLNHTASYLPLVFKGLSELIEFLKKKRANKKAKKIKNTD